MSLDYKITNETFLNGENLTIYLTVLGFLPGNVNSVIVDDESIPIIGRQEINLIVSYVDNGEIE